MRGVAVIVGCALAAHAQAVDVDAAKAHYAAGTTYFQADRFADALGEFQHAYELSHRPALLYNIGLCHERLGHVSEAVTAYQQYLDSGPGGDDRSDAWERIARLRAPPPQPATVKAAPVKKRRAWIWGVVGAAAVVVVGAVVVGVVVGTRDTTPVLPDVVPK
jgi:tetratricopeptide (TPR) repeat protein